MYHTVTITFYINGFPSTYWCVLTDQLKMLSELMYVRQQMREVRFTDAKADYMVASIDVRGRDNSRLLFYLHEDTMQDDDVDELAGKIWLYSIGEIR